MPTVWLPSGALRKRRGTCQKTVDRDVERGLLPQPVYRNGRRYWNEAEVEEYEHRAAGRQTPDPERFAPISAWRDSIAVGSEPPARRRPGRPRKATSVIATSERGAP